MVSDDEDDNDDDGDDDGDDDDDNDDNDDDDDGMRSLQLNSLGDGELSRVLKCICQPLPG